MHDSALIDFPASHGAASLPFDTNSTAAGCAVKHLRETAPLTLGGCIASVCSAYGLDRAEGILRFAVNSGILVFPGQRQVEIAPRDPRTDGLPNRHQATGLIRYFLRDGYGRRPATARTRHYQAPAVFLPFPGSTSGAHGSAPAEWTPRIESRTG